MGDCHSLDPGSNPGPGAFILFCDACSLNFLLDLVRPLPSLTEASFDILLFLVRSTEEEIGILSGLPNEWVIEKSNPGNSLTNGGTSLLTSDER